MKRGVRALTGRSAVVWCALWAIVSGVPGCGSTDLLSTSSWSLGAARSDGLADDGKAWADALRRTATFAGRDDSVDLSVVQDPESRRLIEEELAQTPPERRQVVFRDLKDLEPDMLRQVVEIRRGVRQAGQSGKTAADNSEVPAAASPEKERQGPTIGHSQDERVVTLTASGLGAINPWNAAANSSSKRTSPIQTVQYSPSPRPEETAQNPVKIGFSGVVGDALPPVTGSPAAAVPTPDFGPKATAPRQTPDNPATLGRPTPAPPAEPQQPPAPNNFDLRRQYSSEAPNSKWESDLQRLVSLAEAEIVKLNAQQSGGGNQPVSDQAYMQRISKHVHLRMLRLIAGQYEQALVPIVGIEPADQEFWQQMFWALANYFDTRTLPRADERAAHAVTQLRSAIDWLRQSAQLELKNLTFCQKIFKYGNYQPFQNDEFSPGQPVLVYAEVENFRSVQTKEGQFATTLQSTIEIYNAQGGLVERLSFPPTEDLCRNHRRDYFHSYEFTIPQRISLGPHVLKLIVEDQNSGKTAASSINFTVK